MLEQLKQEVYEANMLLWKSGLVILTWGNVSGIDREEGLFVIKPSGVNYDELTPEMMVVVDLNGKKVEGEYNPSSDTPTHAVLYEAFPFANGVVHTHSTFATALAQAGVPLAAYGTTHADYFYGDVPCTRPLKREEIDGEYEKETGNVIVETFKKKDIKATQTQAVLVCNHGPFTWGFSAKKAVENAIVLEETSKMAILGNMAAIGYSDNLVKPISRAILDKHYLRKHGATAYYGQGGSND